MRLRANELCPIHQSISCCGREFIPRVTVIRTGVRRIEDPHHPRGYRELRSPAEMKKLLNRKVEEQNGICAICEEPFTDYSDVVPDHIEPREWADLGETIIQTTSRQHIGGAMKKRDQ